MNTHGTPIAMPACSAKAGASSVVRAKVIAIEAVQTLSGIVRDALFAYAMTGSPVAGLVIIAAPHFDMLLRCTFQGRG